MASEVTIKHVHELLQLMAVMTQDNRFDDIYSPDMERRTMTMCEVLMNYLLTNNRTEDAKKATEDKAYRNKLLSEIFEKK
ncbi:hypothetical protein [uncultured Acetatifactor sp.]|uniref:hypothetical protein n=1 Tax=uncultured Acetatifactor sp. TaxID=1671927 RepID=UPI002624A4A4|nr:hypothetical protein [uncultured Acetatifactor sp.]